MSFGVLVDTGPLVAFLRQHDEASIMTLDSDFRVYRKHGGEPIALITPQ